MSPRLLRLGEAVDCRSGPLARPVAVCRQHRVRNPRYLEICWCFVARWDRSFADSIVVPTGFWRKRRKLPVSRHGAGRVRAQSPHARPSLAVASPACAASASSASSTRTPCGSARRAPGRAHAAPAAATGKRRRSSASARSSSVSPPPHSRSCCGSADAIRSRSIPALERARADPLAAPALELALVVDEQPREAGVVEIALLGQHLRRTASDVPAVDPLALEVQRAAPARVRSRRFR